ncbi:MAG: type II toxin-antitoxin system PemK/MazF family toxin [Thermomicrobiales bacterium]
MSTGNASPSGIRRGEVYDARLDPVEGSEQGGTRPVVVVSRNAINEASDVLLIVPCTSYRRQRVYRSQVILAAPDGGLTVDSVAMGEQVRTLSKSRIVRRCGLLSSRSVAQIERALMIALGLSRFHA